MRILVIRGQNLASLAERFEIDLTSSPLAGTGLFAITGDTGAGKSTILDALCLALYGDYPRAQGEGREKIRDPSDHEVQSSDPRNVLRRGAGEGFAEVDFVGQDSQRYRVRWTVRRARGKPNGKLQNVERQLYSLETSTSVAVGINEVNAAVVSRTGLTFAQFGRTVLLAQGGFDAFLTASEADRAELLEKITGTEIYSRVSKRVHDETALRTRTLDEHRSDRAAIPVATAEHRSATTAELASAEKHVIEVALQIKAADERLKLAERIAAARSNLAAAEAAHATADEAWRASVGDRELLDVIVAVEPVRAHMTALAEFDDEVATAEGNLRMAGAALDLARGANEEALRDVAASEQARAVAEGDESAFEPIWLEATELDHQINAAEAEWRASAEAAQDAARIADTAATTLANAQRERHDAEEKSIAAEHRLVEASHLARLSDGRAHIAGLFDERAARQAQLRDARALFDTTAREAATTEAAIDASRNSIDQHKNTLAKIEKRIAFERNEFERIDLASLTERDDTLRTADRSLERTIGAVRRRDEARSTIYAARDQVASAKRLRAEAQLRMDEGERTLAEAAVARREVAHLSDLAEATASKHAERLRAQLADDAPCPVCGATDHPFGRHQDAASEVIRAARQRRAELDKAIDAASHSINASSSEIARMEGTLAQANQAIESALRDEEAATAVLIGLLPSLAAVALLLGQEFSNVTGEEEILPERLETLARAIAAARDAVATQQKRASTLQVLIADLTANAARERAAIDEKDGALRVALNALPILKAEHGRNGAICESLAEQIAANREKLTPFLACAGLSVDALGDDAGPIRERLRALADTYLNLVADQQRLASLIDTRQQELRDAEHAEKTAAERRDHLREADQVRKKRLDDFRSRRAQLLGGEATHAHRERVLAARDCARADARQAGAARELASRALAERQLELAACERNLAKVRSRRESSRGQLAEALRNLRMDEPRARELLSIPAERRMRLESIRDQLTRARDTAAANLATRRRDLDEATINGTVPISEVDEILAHRGELDANRSSLTAQIALLRDGIQRDNDARTRADELDAVISGLEQELNVWKDVDAAIGQADGAKFRRFAQGITLRQLVALANAQLATLNPRYQLRQASTSDLTIEVVDRDMGEDARSVRSLSGGERFLVSLALALALSSLEGRQSFVDTLFIDEGFGSLDRETLDIAIDALEALHGQGRKVGVVTHVSAMMERIAVQVRVIKRGGGRSVVRVGLQ